MAVPKRKVSKARRDDRKANWRASAPTLVECSHCKAQIPSHTVCPECGYYDGREVIAKKNKEDKK